ncbi:hypothetical protein [Aestuariivirga litoralis]|uniref:hypothetical protein n=1 Tax=Aestuariivirga litoralis TaxID=2650924 RepID=UPI0018C52AC8|nr:hypothetical protein [Aestuariivirga litoralis]MBG1231462.1 hypothetical protein [Aestuariivirga litoralis]
MTRRLFGAASFAVPLFSLTLFATLTLASHYVRAEDAKPPIPIPDGVEDLSYSPDAASGTLDYTSTTSVKDLAAFYKTEMKKAGWKESPSVIHNDNMQVLMFKKDGKDVNLTIMQMGDHAMINGTGDGLAGDGKPTDSADSGDSGDSDSGNADAGGSKVALVAEDKDGYPVPTEHSMLGSESSIFRKSINVTTSASVIDLTAFYQNELPKKGFTTTSEHTGEDNVVLVYDTPNGPLTVAIKKEGDGASATLSISDKAAASKSPLFPKPGQVKLALGNINDSAAEVSVNGKKVKVKGGAGAKAPDGPTMDVAPGDIKIEVKGAPPEIIKAGPDQIWMVMVGPGGLLPIQAY